MENEIYSLLVGHISIKTWWILICTGFALSLVCVFYLATKGLSMFVNGILLGMCGFFFIVASYAVNFLDNNSRTAARILSSENFKIEDVRRDKTGEVSKISISSVLTNDEGIHFTAKAVILSENIEMVNKIFESNSSEKSIDLKTIP